MSTWYEKGVFYHMYPLGMTGAPKTNYLKEDGSLPETTDRFPELELWLPHIKKLGCNAIYIGPLFDSSTHGYDTRNYRHIDNRLGTVDSFKHFTAQCHEQEIKVVVDGVFNHTGREFFAFKDIQQNRDASPYKDWYKGINFGWGSPLGDSFGYDAWQGHYELPCLNLWNPAVKQYLFDTIRFWIDTFDIDGIRLDCANVLDFGFMKELRSQTQNMKQDFWLMGEVIHGEYNRWVNPEMLHSVTNYELHKGLYSGHNDHNYFEIAHTVRRLEQVGQQLYTFVDNHDEDRLASKLKEKANLFPVYTLLFTLPGIPSIYYGSEWGIEGHRSQSSDEVLRPHIDSSQIPQMNASENPELTEFIMKLGHIHDANPEFWGGSYKELLLTNKQYSFARFADQSVIITAVNNDSESCTLSVPVPVSGTIAFSLLDQTELPIENGRISISIPGNQGMIYKIK